MSSGLRKRSPLWSHFTEPEPKKAKCVYCAQVLCMPSGNVGNLGRHLKTKHPTVPLTVERQTSVPNQEVEIYSEPAIASESSVSYVRSAVSLPGLPPMPTNPAQSSIKDFTQSTKPIPQSRSQKIDDQLITMIAKEYHPLRLVEDKEFQKFVSMLCPGYSLPSRKTLSNSLLPKLYTKTLEVAKKKIENAKAVCLATDGWTSVNNESFIAVMAHFIVVSEKEMELNSILLGCIEYSERHTSANLVQFLKSIIFEWKLENKVTAIASDNAANITAAIKIGDWRQIPCFAHTVNLCVQASLVHLSRVTLKVKAIVEFFKRSAHALSKLMEMQKQLNLNPLKLKQDVSTRWNSTYEMFQRMCSSKDAVIATVALLRSELSLTDHDWLVMEQAVQVLELFYNVTVEISSEKNVTLSKVIPLCRIMSRHIKSRLNECNQQHQEIRHLLETLDSELEKRFASIEQNVLYCEATILDPRFKQRAFSDQRRFERAATELKQKIGRNAPPTATPMLVAETQEPQASTSKASGSHWHHWDDFDAEISMLTPINSTAAGIVEFDKYMQEPMLHRTREPLTWWHERRHIYPLLFQYILKRLHLVATSVPCERIFSKAGYTMNERRTRLGSKKLSQLLFISHNM